MSIVRFAFVFLLLGCSQNRNFDGAPKSVGIDKPPMASSEDYYPEVIYGFRPNLQGFDFSIFQRSANGYYGRSIVVQINYNTSRVSLENANFGKLECLDQGDVKTCQVAWLNNGKFYEFDTTKYQLKLKLKKIVAVLRHETIDSSSLQDCTLNTGGNFINGDSLEVSLVNIETMDTKKIIYYNFGSQNLGVIPTDNVSNVSYFYSFDFDKYFNNIAYFYDSYPIRNMGNLKLFRVGARALNEADTSNFVQFCFYDNI